MAQSLNPSQTSSRLTLSGGNLIITLSNQDSNFQSSVAVNMVTTGKWYWEAVQTVQTVNNSTLGIATAAFVAADGNYIGSGTSSAGNSGSGFVFYNAGTVATTNVSWAANKVIGVAWDATNGRLWWNNWTDTGIWTGDGTAGDPVVGTHFYSVPFVGTAAAPAVGVGNSASNTDSWTMRFAAASFTGTIPSGYSAADGMAAMIPIWLFTA